MFSILELRTIMDLFTLLFLISPTLSWWRAARVFRIFEEGAREGANVDVFKVMKIQSGWISVSCILTGVAAAYLFVINPPT